MTEESVVEFVGSFEQNVFHLADLNVFIDGIVKGHPDHFNFVFIPKTNPSNKRTILQAFASRVENDDEMIKRLKDQQKISQAW